MRKQKNKISKKATEGITLVALVVTIVVLLILAGITIIYTMGENSVFNKVQTELAKIEERAQAIYTDKLTENVSNTLNDIVETSNVIEQLISEGYDIEKEEGAITGISLDKEGITIGLNKTAEINVNYEGEEETFVYYVEVQGKYYKMHSNKGFITIDREESTLTKVDFENENGEETTILKIKTDPADIVTARLKEGSYNTIEVTSKEVEGDTEITVTYGEFESEPCTVKVVELEIEEEKAFSRANGVIDVVWLNIDNTVRTESQGPISPKDYLGGLTAIKYDGTKWAKADEENGQNDWYNYVAQTGTNDGKTSNWANAVANFERPESERAYFVWIPRYAYKITYFDTPSNANAYRADKTKKTGIIGYSNINGIIDVSTGTEKLVKGSEPSNVTGTVKTTEYADYIPHPAFEFDGAKAGIWGGKFESSGNIGAVRIIPNASSLRNQIVSDIFTACQGVKNTYNLTGDSHMMKNTEWGAIAYLAESKYGRNGTKMGTNSSNYTTGQGNYVAYTNQSTTGNIYGIYDMSGGAWEYVAGYINNSDVSSNGQNTSLVNAVKTNPKYADVYTAGTSDDQSNNYSNSKRMKGDAVFETSTKGSGSSGWHSGTSDIPCTSNPVFGRSRSL